MRSMLIGYSPRLMASLILFTLTSSIGADDAICLIDDGTSADFSSTLSLAFAAAADDTLVASCDIRSGATDLRVSKGLTVFFTIPTILVDLRYTCNDMSTNLFSNYFHFFFGHHAALNNYLT